MIKINNNSLPLIISKNIHKDNRGVFFENFNKKYLKNKLNINFEILQHNISSSKKGTVRGLHYQIKKPQSKIIRVIQGKIFDVVLDIRKKSKNYGKVFTFKLNSKNKSSLYIPNGYAHGFMALENNTIVEYFVDEFRFPEYERTILWSDKNLSIKWPKMDKIFISQKDMKGAFFKL